MTPAALNLRAIPALRAAAEKALATGKVLDWWDAAVSQPATILALLDRLAAADRIIHLAIRVHLGEDHMGIYVDNLVHDLAAYDRATAAQGDAT